MAVSAGEIEALFRIRDEASATVEKIDKTVQGSVVAFGFLERAGQKAFDVLAGAARSALDTMAGLAVQAVQSAGKYEQTTLAFNTMLGSAEKAAAFLKELQAFAASTPFEFPSLVTASQKLLAMGFAAKDVIPTLRSIGDATAGLGLGDEGINRITLAMGQMNVKAKLSGGEMRQLTEAGINATKYLADAFGKTQSEIADMTEKGMIKGQDAVRIILAGMGQQFGGLMDAQSKTLLGQVSNLKDAFGFVLRDFGTALLPALGVIVQAAGPLLEALKDLSKVAAENKDALAEMTRDGLMLLLTGFAGVLGGIKFFVDGLYGLERELTGVLGVVMKVGIGLEQMAKVAAAPLKAAAIWEEFKIRVQAVDIVVNQHLKASTSSMTTFDKAIDGVLDVTVKMGAAVANTAKDTATLTDKTNASGGAHYKAAQSAKEAADAARALSRDLNIEDKAIAGAAATAKYYREEQLKAADADAQRLAMLGQLKKELTAGEIAQLKQTVGLRDLNKVIPEATGLWTRYADVVDQEVANSFEHLNKKVAEAVPLTERLLNATLMLGEALGGAVGGALVAGVHAWDSYKEQMASAAKLTDETAKNTEQLKAKMGLASAAAGALGGMLQSNANPNIQKLGGALSGAATGAKIGTAILPGWGTAIGAAAGAVFGFLHKAKQLREELVKIKDGFVDSMGGMDVLKAHAAEAGIALDAIWQAKDKKHLLAAIDEVKEKLATWDESQQALNAAVEKYGFTIDELGPKFAQQKLDVMAGDLLKDYKLLTAAGVEHQAILERMGPAFTEYVDAAVASGASIPMAMKATIDEMYKAGTLIHANGEAFTDAEYAGLSFTQTMTEQFETLIEKIDAMVSAMLGIPANVTTTVTTRHEDEYVNGGGRDHGAPPEEVAAASGFSGWVNSPTRFLVGEAGPEHVQVTPSGKTSGGTSNADVVAAIDALGRTITTVLPKSVLHAVQTGRA